MENAVKVGKKSRLKRDTIQSYHSEFLAKLNFFVFLKMALFLLFLLFFPINSNNACEVRPKIALSPKL